MYNMRVVRVASLGSLHVNRQPNVDVERRRRTGGPHREPEPDIMVAERRGSVMSSSSTTRPEFETGTRDQHTNSSRAKGEPDRFLAKAEQQSHWASGIHVSGCWH